MCISHPRVNIVHIHEKSGNVTIKRAISRTNDIFTLFLFFFLYPPKHTLCDTSTKLGQTNSGPIYTEASLLLFYPSAASKCLLHKLDLGSVTPASLLPL